MKKLIYKFDNPYNNCEKVLFCEENKRYYILQPSQNKGEQILYSCTPSNGYFEAECHIKEGLTYNIDGKVVTTLKDGVIRDEEAYQSWQNEELTLYKIKDEYKDIENYYKSFDVNSLLTKLYDYIQPEHAEKIIVKRKEVFGMGNCYYYKQ